MNPDWQTFLSGRGARFNGDSVMGFASPPSAGADIVADLSHEGVIAVAGSDARTFLQGQLSTDLDALTNQTSQLSSWSTAKGRVVTVLRVVQRGDSILLLLPRALLGTVHKRLAMYVLRAKATLSDASDELVRIGLSGKHAVQKLESAQLPVPPHVNAVASDGATQVIRLHGQCPRFLIMGPADALSGTWTLLSQAGVQPAGEDEWMLQKLLAGEPTVYPETSEHFVAQMIGLEELDAISFKKGCYIGQEIIARAHFRGTVKRHMVRAGSTSKEPLRPGMTIVSDANQQPVAEVVDARRQSGDRYEMLIVIQDDHRHDALRIQDSGDTATVTVTPAD